PAYTLHQKCLKAGIALLGIWLFALLTGGSASVIRASIMFSAIIIGRYVEQNGNVYNSLATAAFFSLIVEPYLIFQVGFQLSYLAVIGIVFFQPKIYKLLYFKYKAVDYLWQITSVSIAAQIAVFPISLYYFHQFPTYFWLSSMIVIPAALIVLLLVIFLFVSQAFLPIMSEVGGELLECLLQLMNRIIFAIERLPFGLVEGVWIEWYDILLWYALIIAATLTVLHRKAKFALASALVFCLISGSYTFKKATQYFNKSITIYHSSDGTIIDLFDAQTTYAVHSSKLEKKTLKWVTQQHRSAMGSKSLYTHFLDEEASTTYDNIWIGLPYIQFYDKRIMLLDHNELQASNEKLELDYMIIHANPNLDLEMVLSSVKVKQII
ncbi:MAG: ComEC/Rec2 family competence protein, partial [Bacteroidota bacterium]